MNNTFTTVCKNIYYRNIGNAQGLFYIMPFNETLEYTFNVKHNYDRNLIEYSIDIDGEYHLFYAVPHNGKISDIIDSYNKFHNFFYNEQELLLLKLNTLIDVY